MRTVKGLPRRCSSHNTADKDSAKVFSANYSLSHSHSLNFSSLSPLLTQSLTSP